MEGTEASSPSLGKLDALGAILSHYSTPINFCSTSYIWHDRVPELRGTTVLRPLLLSTRYLDLAVRVCLLSECQ